MIVLIIPIYNFSKQLPTVLESLTDWKNSFEKNKLRVIFSDDGSTDSTYKMLVEFGSKNSEWFEAITAKKNLGKGAAIRAGFSAALKHEPELIFFTDCDLHYGTKIISEKMIPLLKDNQIVILDRSWVKSASHQKTSRKLLTAAFKRSVSILTGVNYSDTQAGLKGFQAKNCKPIFEKLTLNGFSFDVEILSIALYYRFRVAQVPVAFSENHNFPTSSTISFFKSSFFMLCDLFRINWNWKRGIYKSDELKKSIDDQVYKITN